MATTLTNRQVISRFIFNGLSLDRNLCAKKKWKNTNILGTGG